MGALVGAAAVSHLLRRAGFGLSPGDVLEIPGIGQNHLEPVFQDDRMAALDVGGRSLLLLFGRGATLALGQ